MPHSPFPIIHSKFRNTKPISILALNLQPLFRLTTYECAVYCLPLVIARRKAPRQSHSKALQDEIATLRSQ